jgi:hypothetical protein
MRKRLRMILICFVLLAGAVIATILYFRLEHNRETEIPERQDKSELPPGWSLAEIAEAAPPTYDPKKTYVLAWKIYVSTWQLSGEKKRHTSLVEECLVLTHWQEGYEPDEWVLSVLIRQKEVDDGQWRLATGWDGYPLYSESFDERPSNKKIHGFMDAHGDIADPHFYLGPVTSHDRLLDGKVCKRTWKAVIKEEPTRSFSKDPPPIVSGTSP